MSEATKTVFVRDIKVRLWRRVKSEAALKGETLTEWLENLLEKTFNGNGKAAK
jgi:hypothetical protein